MLRSAGLTEVQFRSDLIDRSFPSAEQFDDPQTRRMRERSEKLARTITNQVIHWRTSSKQRSYTGL